MPPPPNLAPNPPPGAKSIAQILTEARSHLSRITPSELSQEIQSTINYGPVHVIDIRPAAQRAAEGPFIIPPHLLPSSSEVVTSASGTPPQVHIIERNVLEWRLDPQSEARNVDIVGDDWGRAYGTRVVIVCSEGYTSSLAARECQRLGLGRATDLVGGLRGWRSWVEAKGEEV